MPDDPNLKTPKPASAIQWAAFPVGWVHIQLVPRVSDDPIYVQRDDEPPHLVPRGLAAATARFLGQVNGAVRWDHIYQAIGSNQVDPHGIAPLRTLLGDDAIPCQRIPKETRRGTYGAFSFAANIKVWEPEEAEDGHARN
jgi:hypothetical protein